jgi:TIR domain
VAEVCISYSRKDSTAFALKLRDALEGGERKASLDTTDIPITAEWLKEIFANIEAADNFVFVVSPESVASPSCRKEIDHAAACNKRMVPIFHRPVPDEAIPEALGKFQGMDIAEPAITAVLRLGECLVPKRFGVRCLGACSQLPEGFMSFWLDVKLGRWARANAKRYRLA